MNYFKKSTKIKKLHIFLTAFTILICPALAFKTNSKNSSEMKESFLIVDIQNDYFDGGKMALKNAEKASKNAKNALTYFREKKIQIIHVKHIDVHKKLHFFKPNTFGAEIHQSVKPEKGEPIFTKHAPNAFCETELLSYLKKNGITKLTICGMMTHMCVDATTRAAKDYGFEVRLLEDACATMDLEYDGKIVSEEFVHASFVTALSQYYAEIIKANDLIKSK